MGGWVVGLGWLVFVFWGGVFRSCRLGGSFAVDLLFAFSGGVVCRVSFCCLIGGFRVGWLFASHFGGEDFIAFEAELLRSLSLAGAQAALPKTCVKRSKSHL